MSGGKCLKCGSQYAGASGYCGQCAIKLQDKRAARADYYKRKRFKRWKGR